MIPIFTCIIFYGLIKTNLKLSTESVALLYEFYQLASFLHKIWKYCSNAFNVQSTHSVQWKYIHSMYRYTVYIHVDTMKKGLQHICIKRATTAIASCSLGVCNSFMKLFFWRKIPRTKKPIESWMKGGFVWTLLLFRKM